jgi:hypothetical protein
MKHFIASFLLLSSVVFAGEAPSSYDTVAIRLHNTPCAYYLMNPLESDRAIRLTDAQDPQQLEAAFAKLKQNPEEVLRLLNVENLSHVVVSSVGTPLSKGAMQKEVETVEAILKKQGLDSVPVKVFPRPEGWLQRLRWLLPIRSDFVPPANAEQEAEARLQGLQITASANFTVWVTLGFLGAASSASADSTAFLLAIPATAVNIWIDYLVGKNRPSINNFIARAGDSRLSALIRDTQISMIFAVPFYLIPRFQDFIRSQIHSGFSMEALAKQFLELEMPSLLLSGLTGVGEILTSSLLQALQIFTFMNPNARVDKIQIQEGTELSETELRKRNAYRVAGFFAITAPLFAASAHESTPGIIGPLNLAHLLMGAIAVTNYGFAYSQPKALLRYPLKVYETLGWALAEYPVEYLVRRPLAGARHLWNYLRGVRPNESDPTTP